MTSIGPIPIPNAGARATGTFTFADDPGLAKYQWPYVAIRGKRDGASVLITAGIHAAEYTGIEAAIRLGRTIDPSEVVTYRGVMFTELPNLAYVFGYFRASWTLRADIISDLVCRLLATMEAKGATRVVPTLRPEDEGMELGLWVDPDNFNPGYLMRTQHRMPKRGDKEPWTFGATYSDEKAQLEGADFEDGTLSFS